MRVTEIGGTKESAPTPPFTVKSLRGCLYFMSTIPFKSFEDQIKKIRDKNILIDKKDESRIIEILKNHSYYSLVNGYKPHFLLPGESDLMEDGTTFDHFFVSRMLDIDMSNLIFKYILLIEQSLRTRIAYVIAREFGTDDQKYLDDNNFVSDRVKAKTLKSIKTVRDFPMKGTHSDYFKNIKTVSIPPWILLLDIKYFDVINLYKVLPNNLREEIRKDYLGGINMYRKENIEFINSMQFLREYRNIAAHGKRNFEEKIDYSLDYEFARLFYDNTIISVSDFNSKKKKKDLYACILLIFAYLNDPIIVNKFLSELLFLFTSQEYVDENFKGRILFNNKTIFDINGLPPDFFNRLSHLIQKKINT